MIEEIPKQNRLVSVYGRVSSSNQENEGTIETQLSAVNRLINEKGYIVTKKYIDEGWSGDSIVRPNLDQLRMDAKKKIFDAVVIYDPDRLARRYSYQELIMDELREAGIEVIFVTVTAPKNSEDKILYGVRGLFAEYERAKIAERFRIGKVRKATEGHVITTEAPYGYTFIVKKGKRGDADFRQGYYEINQREAKIVKNIFSWVADDGLTLRAIVRKLQSLGIQPRKSKRGVWNTSTLSTLLRNKTYIGEAHFGASYAVIPTNPTKKEGYKKIKKTSRRMKPESEWIKIPTPRLIEDDLFFRAVARLQSNFEMSSRNTKNDYLLAGKIWCTCGKRRAGEGPQRGKHLYYRCTDRVKSFPLPPTCKEAGLNARIVDKLLWDKVSNLMSSPELLVKQAERWLNNKRKGSPTSTINIEETEKEIAKLKIQEDRYAKAYGVGAITLEQFGDNTKPVKDKIALFENQLLKARSESERVSDATLPKQSEIQIFTQKAAKQLYNLKFNEKKAIVRNVIDKVVGKVGELQVYGYIPVTSNINVCTEDRNRWFTKRGEVHAL